MKRPPAGQHRGAAWCGAVFALLIAPFVAAQGVTEVTITRGCESNVFSSNGSCIDAPSPAERRLQVQRNNLEREKRERDRARQEAEQAEFRRKVDERVKSLGGEHRRAEAERFVTMRDAADAARPKPPGGEQCKRHAYNYEWNTGGLIDVAEARAEYSALRGKACQVRGASIGPITCRRVTVLGEKFASCQASISCASYTYPCSSSRVVGQ